MRAGKTRRRTDKKVVPEMNYHLPSIYLKSLRSPLQRHPSQGDSGPFSRFFTYIISYHFSSYFSCFSFRVSAFSLLF